MPTSLSYPVAINDTLTVEDGSFPTVEEMAQAAELVIVADVVSVTSLSRPLTQEDGAPDEYVAVTFDVAEVFKGELVERVVLAWDAIQVDEDGNRIATIFTNGIRPPEICDRMLLFLDPATASFIEAHASAPTHEPTLFDGVAYLAGDQLVASEPGSPILAMSLPEVRQVVGGAVERPRNVGEPIQPGGG